MIMITTEVPILGACYDVQIDEDMPLCSIRDEIAELICRKNQCDRTGEYADFVLWDMKRQTLLNLRTTAYENGITSGSRLLLA